MIHKVTGKHGGCLDTYLDELFTKNKWNPRGPEYKVDPIEVQLRPAEELKAFCHTGLDWMWTGMTPKMYEAIREGKPMHLRAVSYKKYQSGRTYMVNLVEMPEAWDSRVFGNPSLEHHALDLLGSFMGINE